MKCRFCSWLSSQLKQFLLRHGPDWLKCRVVYGDSYDQKDRVQRIDTAVEGCGCERCRMSWYSPACVQDAEVIARFVFHPMHVGTKGKLRPSLFGHVANKGCSVQRDSMAGLNEIVSVVADFLASDPKLDWRGVALATCGDIRAIRLDDHEQRIVCVYDTAERNNQAHAELCQTAHVRDEGDANELRAELMKAFDAENFIDPISYRDGVVLARLKVVSGTRTRP